MAKGTVENLTKRNTKRHTKTFCGLWQQNNIKTKSNRNEMKETEMDCRIQLLKLEKQNGTGKKN